MICLAAICRYGGVGSAPWRLFGFADAPSLVRTCGSSIFKKKVDLQAIIVDERHSSFRAHFLCRKIRVARTKEVCPENKALKECRDELLRLSIVLAGDQIFQECADVCARVCLGVFMF